MTAKEEVQIYRELLLFLANCPCCRESLKCVRGCTFKEDAPGDYAEIAEIRGVLRRGMRKRLT